MTQALRFSTDGLNGSSSPVLAPEQLTTVAHDVLGMTKSDVATVTLDHLATGTIRVAQNQVRLVNNGDTLELRLQMQFGSRPSVDMTLNQLDADTLRRAVRYLERIAHEQPGDPAPTPRSLPVPPRSYLPNTTWHAATAAALDADAQPVLERLMQPLIDAKLHGAAFVGISAHARLHANTQGFLAVGRSTDAELTASGWAGPGSSGALGWAGQASRDWETLDPSAVANKAVHIARLAGNPVALEPGRRIAILGRPAMAQIIRAIGGNYDYTTTMMGYTPLSGHSLHDKIMDERINLRSDPNDPDGGYLPFDDVGYPRIPMSWLERGRFMNLAYSPFGAARMGVTPGNMWSESLRLDAVPGTSLLTIDDMIANCKEGIYINRVADIKIVRAKSALMTGVTRGGCFLIRNGRADKAVKDFRFLDSPYFFMNKLLAIGQAARAPFGYAPWHGEWPIAPTIVPPVMVNDFNCVALADAI